VIEKGGYDRLRAAGLDAFRSDLATLEPALADRVDELGSWSDVSVLEVRVTGCAAGTGPGCSASATPRMPCPRSAVSASTWPCRTRSRPRTCSSVH
jgi:hypothetical protein